MYSKEQYVAFNANHPLYRRTSDWKNGSYALGLERVSATTVLEDVAIDGKHVSRQTRTAVEKGSVKTRKKLPHANRIVDTPDGYFVVYQSERHPFLKTNPETEWIVEWAAVLVGADLLRRL